MIKFKIAALTIAGFLITTDLFAQQQRPLIVAVFSNATALPTHSGEIFRSAHPGFVAGTSFRYNKSPKNQLLQTLKAGYIYHQFVQHSVQLYSELEYKRMVSKRINVSGAFGAGYVHLFSATQVFRRNDQGQYEAKPNRGRPQGMGTFALGAGYLLNQNSDKPVEIFTRYQFWVQAPFVRQYVPVLPNTALQLGLNYPLAKRNNSPKP
jgi:hypothetical protein